MGNAHSSSEESSTAKMSLADRRYRVSGPKAAEAMRRKSTRKLGSVALEVRQIAAPEGGGPGTSENGTNSSGEGEEEEHNGQGDGAEAPGEDNAECGDEGRRRGSDNNSEQSARRPSQQQQQQRRRAQTLMQFQLTRTENAANATILLTRTQRVLIENSWKRAKKAAVEGGMGAKIFHTVLIAQPDIKLLFGLEKVPQGRLKYEGQFRRHAGLLNRALEYIVKNLQYTEKLGHHFQALGKKHCQMNGGRAFPPNYWDTFLECIIQSALEMDSASGGRQHRCRETAIAWRNLISFIVQQMRRGFDDERLLRKRFSASLMGLRGSNSTALNEAYNGAIDAQKRAQPSGRPRPSLAHNAHGSLGSLEAHFHHAPSISPQSVHQRARAASSISPLVYQLQHQQRVSMVPPQWESEKDNIDDGYGRLQPKSGDNSARSASWCAEVTGDELRRLQLSEPSSTRTARSELTIDSETGEAFYTPRTTPRSNLLQTTKTPSPRAKSQTRDSGRGSSPPPKQAVVAVQLMLSAANPESAVRGNKPGLSSSHSFTRHSFSAEEANAPSPGERAAAVDASKRLLGVAHAHLGIRSSSARRLSAYE